MTHSQLQSSERTIQVYMEAFRIKQDSNLRL